MTFSRRSFLTRSAAAAGITAVGGLGSLGLTACDPASTRASERIADLIWTYGWPCPRATYLPGSRKIHVGGTTSTGMVSLGTFDTAAKTASKVALVDHQADDHDTPAMLFEADQRPIIVVSDHNRTAYAEQWLGDAPLSVTSLTPSQITWGVPPAYGQLVRRPGTSTLMSIFRGGPESGQYGALSRDWGISWEAPVRIWGGPDYATHKITHDGSTLWMATAINPAFPGNEVRVFQVDLASGAIRNSSGTRTSLQNFWSLTGPITAGDCTRAVAPLVAPHALRLFDVSTNGDVVIARWDSGDPTVSYRLLRRVPTTETYAEEVLVDGGVEFGYTPARYTGGMTFDVDADHILLCREASGTWTYERWTCTSGAWASDVLVTRTAASGRKLGRPIVPRGAEGMGLTLVLDIAHYSATRYTVYLADAMLVRDLGAYST